jgi:hypothetical protein
MCVCVCVCIYITSNAIRELKYIIIYYIRIEYSILDINVFLLIHVSFFHKEKENCLLLLAWKEIEKKISIKFSSFQFSLFRSLPLFVEGVLNIFFCCIR